MTFLLTGLGVSMATKCRVCKGESTHAHSVPLNELTRHSEDPQWQISDKSAGYTPFNSLK